MPLDQEALLKIWLETKPSARSPYSLYGNPPMWETLNEGLLTLFTRPGKTHDRPATFMPYQEVDGVHYQWQYDGRWVGQGHQSTFAYLLEKGAAKTDVPKGLCVRIDPDFDWSQRTSQPVLDLPFVEGMPSPEKAKAMSAWVRDNADIYANKLVKLYHATGINVPVVDEGLKPTSSTRRRSLQSASGYCYLANTPDRAKAFGDLGNGGTSIVYEVVVPVRHLKADLDQLANQRSVGVEVGNSIGESIIYGGGARIKGAIPLWAVRPLTPVDIVQLRARDIAPPALPQPRARRSGASRSLSM